MSRSRSALWFILLVLGDAVLADVATLSRHRRSLDWNVIVDELLVQVRENIIAEGKDEQPIPDVNESFQKKFGFIKMTGHFEAHEGRVLKLSSIRRTGDVTFTGVPGQTVELTAHLGFGHLQVIYNHYKAKIWRMGPRGRISAGVRHNSVRLRVRLTVEGESCSVTLQEATVLDVDGFDVDISGLGPLNWLTEKIIEWVAKRRRGNIKEKLQSGLQRGLERALTRFNCNKHIDQMRGITG